jgi:hypothetical protein
MTSKPASSRSSSNPPVTSLACSYSGRYDSSRSLICSAFCLSPTCRNWEESTTPISIQDITRKPVRMLSSRTSNSANSVVLQSSERDLALRSSKGHPQHLLKRPFLIILISFLPSVKDLQLHKSICDKISTIFHVPSFFWTKTAYDANGFFEGGYQPIEGFKRTYSNRSVSTSIKPAHFINLRV